MVTRIPPVSTFSTDPPLSGFVAPGFEAVRERFLAQLRAAPGSLYEQLGASFAAFHRGRCVVCLFGGWEDQSRTRPFGPETLTVIMSNSKTITGIAAVKMISEGRLRWDTPVAELWPEFRTGHKEGVTVRDILEHQGGVGWMDREHIPTIDEARDLDRMAAKIAGQPHNFGGKLVKSYHGISGGWFLNEVFRRAHPERKTLGEILLGEINAKLGIEIYCGLPSALQSRVCRVVMAPSMLSPPSHPIPAEDGDPCTIILNPEHEEKSLTRSFYTGIRDIPPEPANERTIANSRRALEVETPSGFLVSNAYSMAALASTMSRKGEGWLADERTWEEAHTLEHRNLDQRDTVIGTPIRTTWAGFMLSDPGVAIPGWGVDWVTGRRRTVVPEARRPGWEWTGWAGTGGSIMQWCAGHEVSIGFLPNYLHLALLGDERGKDLALALVEFYPGQLPDGILPGHAKWFYRGCATDAAPVRCPQRPLKAYEGFGPDHTACPEGNGLWCAY
ncbi:beta-lactamase/transpeptidase-like protein [Hyaloraphidium curvatum]|nr:beta-lactamase/transpeptidase-like protein [Hyaloraphidium curvatum]